MPKGKTGHDHQYQGFNHGAPGKVMTLLGPHGTDQRSLRSTELKETNQYYNNLSASEMCIVEHHKRCLTKTALSQTHNNKRRPFGNLEAVEISPGA